MVHVVTQRRRTLPGPARDSWIEEGLCPSSAGRGPPEFIPEYFRQDEDQEAGKTKQRSRRIVSQSGLPGRGRKTLGTVALMIDPS